jgi:hypothetical protein
MFYEEANINGVWYWRGRPNGQWIAMDSRRLHNKISDLENTLGAITNHLENCHADFKNRKHGGVAEQKLRHGLEDVLQMPYDG